MTLEPRVARLQSFTAQQLVAPPMEGPPFIRHRFEKGRCYGVHLGRCYGVHLARVGPPVVLHFAGRWPPPDLADVAHASTTG